MRLVAAAVAFMLLTGTAYAQINLWPEDPTKDPAAVEKQQAIDKAYREKIKSTAPAQAPVNDPWGNVRANEKPAQSKAQTGSKNR